MPEILEVNVDDMHDVFSQMLVNLDCDTVGRIAENMKDGKVEVSITVGGVELPSEKVFKALKNMLDYYQRRVREVYDVNKLDQLVHKKSEAKLKDEAQPLIDKLHELAQQLEEVGNVLTPYWERK